MRRRKQRKRLRKLLPKAQFSRCDRVLNHSKTRVALWLSHTHRSLSCRACILLSLISLVCSKLEAGSHLRRFGKSKSGALVLPALAFGRSDRVRTCGIDVPNVARYQLRHTPMCEKYSIFRSISVSGQICGQNILSVFF